MINIDKKEFRKLIMQGGTWESMSKHFNVSIKRLKNVHKEQKQPPLLADLKKDINKKKSKHKHLTRIQHKHSPTKELDDRAVERLALAVIVQAIKDHKRGKIDAIRFLESEYFDFWIQLVGLDTEGKALAETLKKECAKVCSRM